MKQRDGMEGSGGTDERIDGDPPFGAPAIHHPVPHAPFGACALCGREETLTRHHLIPRTRHRTKRTKREFDRATLRQTVGLCQPCHAQLHLLFTEKELEREGHTLEQLRGHPDVAHFLAWIADKPRGFRLRARRERR